jgi:hypothetical protein
LAGVIRGQTIQWSTEEEQTIQWSTEDGQTIQWSTEVGQTIQWSTEEEQTIQWSTEDGQTIQWTKEKNTMFDKIIHRKLKIEQQGPHYLSGTHAFKNKCSLKLTWYCISTLFPCCFF